jgi:hypothetical protein
MRLFRGFRPKQMETDSKNPDEYIELWRDTRQIWLKGTKTRGARRGTDLFLEIDDADVLALFHALIDCYQKSGEQGEAMRKEIRRLIYEDKSREELLSDIDQITRLC